MGKHYDYFRDYDPAIGRYIQSDLVGLKGGFNTFGYVRSDPLQQIDRLGLDAVFVHYVGYGVGLGRGVSLPLGHAGVIAIDPQTGATQYYDFGRFGGACGDVRGPYDLGTITFDEKGNPTRVSVEAALEIASRAFGKGSPTYSEYSRKDFQGVIDYVERRRRQANTCGRPYNFLFDNCKNFAREAAGR